MVWRIDDPQGAESKKVRHMIVPYTRGQGLDLGCGPWPAWPHFTGMDNFDEYQGVADPATGQHWRPDVTGDCTDLSMFADDGLDFVFSSHLLEHIEDTEATLREWWRVIKPGGHLCLYLPDKDLYPNIGEEGANPDHKHDFSRSAIVDIMKRVGGWNLLQNQKRDKGTEYSLFQVYRKAEDGEHHFGYKARRHDKRPRCLCLRYGGIGDCIMLSSILPGLQDQGYHVTVQTTPRGEEILRHDPHIDAFWIQDHDQVPNHELQDYWEALGPEFDTIINLCESVEGSLLALPDRRNHAMPQAARHLAMNVNYLDFTHAIAGVPGPHRPRFFASEIERRRAAEYRSKLGAGPVILWAIAGSSIIHKIWPWTETVATWLLQHTDAKIVFVGTREHQVLEHAVCQTVLQEVAGVPAEESHEMKLEGALLRLKEHFGGINRLICRSGSWPIRDTLAFAEHADVVVGPETGVLNAVSMLDVPKVVMLSHSSPENLTRDWPNCTVLEPAGVDCWPCHRMHYTRDCCPQDEATGAAACAAAIAPREVFDAIVTAIDKREAA